MGASMPLPCDGSSSDSPCLETGGLEGVVPSILVVRRNCCEEGECHNLAYKLIVN